MAAPRPASPASLACVLSELGQRGYEIRVQSSGSLWYQAVRIRRGVGEEIWIRLVDDGARPAWLDLRASLWSQASPAPTLDGRPISALATAAEGSEEMRTVRERCGGR